MSQDHVSMPMRDKVWPERTDAEKLDALREQVVYLLNRVEHVAAVVEQLLRHEHNAGGQLTVQIQNNSEPSRRSHTPMSLRNKE